MTQKGNVRLYLDKELVEKSKELSFNLGKTFENHSKHLMTQFSACNLLNNVENIENKRIVVGLPGFEPESIEPKSTSLDQASRQPHAVRLHHGWLGCLRILFSERGIQNGQPIAPECQNHIWGLVVNCCTSPVGAALKLKKGKE
jgi:hypothetical protein